MINDEENKIKDFNKSDMDDHLGLYRTTTLQSVFELNVNDRERAGPHILFEALRHATILLKFFMYKLYSEYVNREITLYKDRAVIL